MEFRKIVNLLDTGDKYFQDFLPRNRLKFKINQKGIIMSTKKLELKHQC